MAVSCALGCLSVLSTVASLAPDMNELTGRPFASRPRLMHHDDGGIRAVTAPVEGSRTHAGRASPLPIRNDDNALNATTATAAAAAEASAAASTEAAASDAIALAVSTAQVSSISWSRFRAVTIVHKPCSTLSYTLTNFAGNLGPDWPILVIYTPRAKDAVLNNKVVRYLSRYGGLHVLALSALAIPGLDELTDVSKYSLLLARPEFWEAMHADKVLIFQTDSVLCSQSAFTIDDFLAYDYVGAPWVHVDRAVGNGGLSLRSVDKMLHITRRSDRDPHPEDVFFVQGLAAMARDDATSVIRAPTVVAQRFAFEMDQPPDAVPFGVHRSVIVPAETKASVVAGCPEAAVGVWTSCGRGG
jgi:hypothetical protein